MESADRSEASSWESNSFLSLHRPRHSDFTVPTANLNTSSSPPLELPSSSDDQRRAIFGSAVQQRYAVEQSPLQPASNSELPDDVPIISVPWPNHDVAPLLPEQPSPAPVKKRHRPHETIHAQSLLLGLAFCAVWSPNNLMAPNLTDMAQFFDVVAQRDLYLGSYCALATGVLSFPVSAGIGIWTDLVGSRQRLFVATIAGGGLASLATAFCTKYWQLLLLRFWNGGFMSGSVPVAFSFLGDLFATEERNAASSGLTAMMGMGIILGQVYAGTVGATLGWQHAFIVSGVATLLLAALCLWGVQEPVRGGKEKVLQDMIQAGTRYERKLTWSGFWHAMKHNKSNSILLWQGFFSSLPWGVIFVFLNDFLSQERGFSVPDATYLVLLFGLGCAAGGILGGYWGQKLQAIDRRFLPLFMSATTVLAAGPFLLLLNSDFTNAHGFEGFLYAFGGGLIASLPSVNVRPCLINVNPPETRGASLTAANLLINLGRGFGPSCITLMGSIWHVDRTFALNVNIIVFWSVAALQLLFLAKTLPEDQDAMEAELAMYARQAMDRVNPQRETSDSVVSIEERMTSFDSIAAQETLLYVTEGIKEFRAGVSESRYNPFHCGEVPSSDEEHDDDDDQHSAQTEIRRNLWKQQQQENGYTMRDRRYPNETTSLIV